MTEFNNWRKLICLVWLCLVVWGCGQNESAPIETTENPPPTEGIVETTRQIPTATHLPTATQVPTQTMTPVLLQKNERRLTYTQTDEVGPTWSPDGKMIAFLSERDGLEGIYVLEVESGEETHITVDDRTISYWGLDWSPDGSRLAVCALANGIRTYLVNVLEALENPADFYAYDDFEFLPAAGENDEAYSPSWSPDGEQIVFHSFEKEYIDQIYVMNILEYEVVPLTEGPYDNLWADWSPSGGQIAFTSGRDGNYEIYVMDVNGDNQKRLTDEGADDYAPDWSPDGKWITFVSKRDGKQEIYIMRKDGSEQQRLTTNEVGDYNPQWSPDGKWITFNSDRDGNYEIYLIEVPPLEP